MIMLILLHIFLFLIYIIFNVNTQVTNTFLQLLAIAAKHMPDSTKAVKMVLSTTGGGGESNTNAASSNSRVNSADNQQGRL